jgi:hypothetical protein
MYGNPARGGISHLKYPFSLPFPFSLLSFLFLFLFVHEKKILDLGCVIT